MTFFPRLIKANNSCNGKRTLSCIHRYIMMGEIRHMTTTNELITKVSLLKVNRGEVELYNQYIFSHSRFLWQQALTRREHNDDHLDELWILSQNKSYLLLCQSESEVSTCRFYIHIWQNVEKLIWYILHHTHKIKLLYRKQN